jgi:hypothetical protein
VFARIGKPRLKQCDTGSRKRIVICGSGAIGAAIAYFMSRRGVLPIVIGSAILGDIDR